MSSTGLPYLIDRMTHTGRETRGVGGDMASNHSNLEGDVRMDIDYSEDVYSHCEHILTLPDGPICVSCQIRGI